MGFFSAQFLTEARGFKLICPERPFGLRDRPVGVWIAQWVSTSPLSVFEFAPMGF
jgi:hypothetical protein